MSKNLFFDLPQELMCKIYQFDSTYRDKYIDILDSLPLIESVHTPTESNIHLFFLITKQHSLDSKKFIKRIEKEASHTSMAKLCQNIDRALAVGSYRQK